MDGDVEGEVSGVFDPLPHKRRPNTNTGALLFGKTARPRPDLLTTGLLSRGIGERAEGKRKRLARRERAQLQQQDQHMHPKRVKSRRGPGTGFRLKCDVYIVRLNETSGWELVVWAREGSESVNGSHACVHSSCLGQVASGAPGYIHSPPGAAMH